MHKLIRDFEIQTDHLFTARRPDLVIVNKKKKERERENLPNSEKRDKYVDLAGELKKKLWNMKVTVIPIVICVNGTFTKGLVLGLEDLKIRRLVETIQTTQQHY